MTLRKQHRLWLFKETMFISEPKMDGIRGCWRNFQAYKNKKNIMCLDNLTLKKKKTLRSFETSELLTERQKSQPRRIKSPETLF